ncbi:uncharacterized protein DUF2470 [Motilibacter rhizosphaerae]|uniref:Uncharacterized protein DUF2470 n=1 Tax=Motilibacter rhizosphaerae TaxID=598652 RepID=A0A4Q7NUS4_9ACTN|nr:DUF2470 domain-containing protein [Motilibacter rhizosphaerae]RZS90961.1 uncharacterized protein DUF2470 [Motilibacter rhizosphaerae]
MTRSLPHPTVAEAARSVVASAASLTLVTSHHRAHLEGRHLVDARGGLRLSLPADSAVATALRLEEDLVATVELTDVAPVAVRDRVRARLALTGWLELLDDDGTDTTAYLVPGSVDLDTCGRRHEIDPEEYAVADPDPLTGVEAEVLTHLDAEHRAELDALLSSCDPALDGGRRTRPLRLDRHGLTVRVERASGECDVRLAFPAPVRTVAEVGEAVRCLGRAAAPRTRRGG